MSRRPVANVETVRRTRVKARSDERRELNYPAFVESYLAWHQKCEVGPIIESLSGDPVVVPSTDGWHCRRKPSGLHHLRKRSAAGALTNPANVVACCSPCNSWIEDHPALAYGLRLVVREGDPEWDNLGARVWRGK